MTTKNIDLALQQARGNLSRKSTHFKTCFSTVSGGEVIKAIREEFGSDEICKPGMDQTDIVIRAAQADVLSYIKLMMNFNEEQAHVDET